MESGSHPGGEPHRYFLALHRPVSPGGCPAASTATAHAMLASRLSLRRPCAGARAASSRRAPGPVRTAAPARCAALPRVADHSTWQTPMHGICMASSTDPPHKSWPPRPRRSAAAPPPQGVADPRCAGGDGAGHGAAGAPGEPAGERGVLATVGGGAWGQAWPTTWERGPAGANPVLEGHALGGHRVGQGQRLADLQSSLRWFVLCLAAAHGDVGLGASMRGWGAGARSTPGQPAGCEHREAGCRGAAGGLLWVWGRSGV